MSQPVSPRTSSPHTRSPRSRSRSRSPRSRSTRSSSLHSDDFYGYNGLRYKNDFEELDPLGKGGFGQVLHCRNKLDGQNYAVKVVPFSSIERERTLWEMKTLAQMHHPNIVQYYQAWIEGGVASVSSSSLGSNSSGAPHDSTLYIVMEVCNETLEEKLKKNPLKHSEAWKIYDEIHEGLKHINKKGVIHRDLSTRNIFLNSEGVAKIGDFGLARFAQDGKVNLSQNSGQGPPKYYAPETCGDNPYAVFASDIFSLGIIFFELFHHMDVSESQRVISNLRSLKIVPENWKMSEHKSTLLKMIAHNPFDRPSLAALEQLLAARSTSLLDDVGEFDSEDPSKNNNDEPSSYLSD